MSEANDLRLEVYIRSMSHLMGFAEVKRILAKVIPELESELISNPGLVLPKKFSSKEETKTVL